MAYLEALEAASDAALQQDRLADVARSSDDILQIARGLDDETYVAALVRAAFSRSMDLGVNTISGLCRPDRHCQRSRWK